MPLIRLLSICFLLWGTLATAQDSLYIRRVGSLPGWGEAPGLFVDDTLAFVATQSGLRVVNISNPAAPVQIGSLTAPGYCYGVVKQGNYVYLGSPDTGVRIVNVSNPGSPQLVGTHAPTGCLVNGVAVNANYVYASDFIAGVRIIDASNAGMPQPRGVLDLPGQLVSCRRVGNLLYIGAMGGGLRIVDCTIPDSLYEVGFFDTPSAATDIAIENDIAYVADNSSLRIIDVSLPSAPFELGRVLTPNSYQFLAVANGFAFVADNILGLRVFDCRDPENPVERGHYDMAARPFSVAMAGEYVCVADEEHFTIYEYTEFAGAPELRVTPAALSFGDIAMGDSAHMPFTIFSIGSDDLLISALLVPAGFRADFSDAVSLAPGESLVVQVTFAPEEVRNFADTLWIQSNAEGGDVGIRLTGTGTGTALNEELVLPNRFALESFPNPFNSVTTVRMVLPSAAEGKVVVYDRLGRLVYTLLNGRLPAGTQEVRFDANELSSGDYFVRFESPQFSAVQKAVLVK